jgi:hypothetical protein
MPSHATAQFNSAIRRKQLAGEDVTASDHVIGEGDERDQQLPFIHPVDNPASPSEFPATREQYAPPVARFAPRTPTEQATADEESTARHRGPMTTAVTPTGEGALRTEGDERETSPGAPVDDTADTRAVGGGTDAEEEDDPAQAPPLVSNETDAEPAE